MKLSLLIGVVLLILGLGMAVTSIVNVAALPSPAVDSNTTVQTPRSDDTSSVAIPIFSGLALAMGGLLIGLSMGNWRHPRTHQEQGDEVVNPEGHHKMKHV